MQELRLPKPIEDMSDEEGRAFLEEGIAYLEQVGPKAKQQFAVNLKHAQERLTYAESELARVDELRTKLAPYKDDPEGSFHLTNAELLHRMFSAMKGMMEVQIHCAKSNIEAVENFNNPLADQLKLLFAEDSTEFLEQRARFDFFMGTFLWHESLVGIDALLRVSVNEKALDIHSEEEEQLRAGTAEQLRASMKADRDAAMLVQKIGTSLHETQVLLAWAQQTLQSLKSLPAAAKRGLLEDPDWAKLNGKVVFLNDLGNQVQAHPLLSQLLPASELGELPYDQVAWSETPGGTGKIGQTGRLGAARGPNTGRIGTQPGSGQLKR